MRIVFIGCVCVSCRHAHTHTHVCVYDSVHAVCHVFGGVRGLLVLLLEFWPICNCYMLLIVMNIRSFLFKTYM